ncbi:hypothetical protein BpHYR1_018840 [Brachionus plicatilis]|uniref:Uncharacterized protein n=1 Tax=Brachionus plicatilis TaxID=10195 RepID=A0A3M7QR89_BRAPC|nr:hypothetical protein BpHYR1_018840 [Brachionus plicatilis]
MTCMQALFGHTLALNRLVCAMMDTLCVSIDSTGGGLDWDWRMLFNSTALFADLKESLCFSVLILVTINALLLKKCINY